MDIITRIDSASINADRFSREALAGYDREAIGNGVAVIVGCGAAGTNLAQTFALVGVGEIRLVDFDVVEPSNLARSPLVRAERIQGRRRRFKAREVGLGTLATSLQEDPVVRVATKRVEEIGLGGLAGSGVVVAAADSLSVRAYLADVCRLLRVPLVELGFRGSRGHVSVFPNIEAGEPCWRCSFPEVEPVRASCSLYAAEVVSEGRIPATQPLAAAISAIAAEAAIQALHGRFPLGSKAVHLDIRDGSARVIGLVPPPECPGVHRSYGRVRDLPIATSSSVASLFDEVGRNVRELTLHLPTPFVVEAPCSRCGTSVPVGRPLFAVSEPPTCRACPEVPPLDARGAVVAVEVRRTDSLSSRLLRSLGIAPGTILEIENTSTSEVEAVRVSGGLDDLYETLSPRNGSTRQRMKKEEPEDEDGGRQ